MTWACDAPVRTWWSQRRRAASYCRWSQLLVELGRWTDSLRITPAWPSPAHLTTTIPRDVNNKQASLAQNIYSSKIGLMVWYKLFKMTRHNILHVTYRLVLGGACLTRNKMQERLEVLSPSSYIATPRGLAGTWQRPKRWCQTPAPVYNNTDEITLIVMRHRLR